ncbi:cupin domain-containing protein [Sphingobium sp.]|uniref:cupin domain-containing protein n=1 Tax=Sphingobium sp. TaxID=1912891 RepID=UPI0028BF0357|nr:cupin domain-containing protein [Sphingobium sp.]
MVDAHNRPDETLRGYMVEPGGSINGGIELRTKAISLAKATAQSTGGAMSVFEIGVRRGRPPHVHQHQDEGLYVISGRLGIRIGEDAFDAPAGSFLFLPKQISHRFWAEEDDTRILLFTTPGGVEIFEGAHLAAETPEERAAISETHGISFVLDAEERALPREALVERCRLYGISLPEGLDDAP